MHAAFFSRTGDPSVIEWVEMPDPVPGPGQVRVRTEAVAVNAVDTLVRSGRWSTPLAFPVAVGRDLVGVVDQIGPGVGGLREGDRVWTSSAGYAGRPGATAELVVVDRDRLYPVPDAADPVAFVASLHPATTAVAALHLSARVQPGETLVVVGANGAVGAALVQEGVASGADVVAVVRDARCVATLEEWGAEVVVADAGSAAEAVAERRPDGIHVFIDTTGRADTASAVRRLAPRGRVIVLAGRTSAEIDLWSLQVRELRVVGFILSALDASELREVAEQVNARWAEGRPLLAQVGGVLGFADAADAHRRMETGDLPRTADGFVGRLVLVPSPPSSAAPSTTR
ncbi:MULTISPECIES: alcohol dehydrogenase catalytic domain-containing protein [Microbacterium]|uniref:alcohol dehydrogenase catalytic domain-containing protein n=1 Tax=Microbacterium TaxID=33882 RepID=UPI0027845148|nr:MULTISPECIES: zinc-binding dehydrogenase [Microbacterium]MDQ1083131.1 NADPH2:quinone reductase [Microbacterium sp. SORGH_AS_0344]MDQ1171597.1 NADPH2:quinone reductase [Microbacterium proteolyticum]